LVVVIEAESSKWTYEMVVNREEKELCKVMDPLGVGEWLVQESHVYIAVKMFAVNTCGRLDSSTTSM
jgi:hypothetical protein